MNLYIYSLIICTIISYCKIGIS